MKYKGQNSITIYNKDKLDYYSSTLKGKLIEIRLINEVHNDIVSGIWDSNIKYRSSWDKNFNSLQSKYYLERVKWVDFIFIPENFINPTKITVSFTIEDLIRSKMRLVLLLFWRDIAHKLDNNTIFKLQLKLNLLYQIPENKDNVDDKPFIRSIGSIRIYNKNKFYEALSYLRVSLSFILDNYTPFYISNIILTYNICHEDSILNTLDLSTQNFNSLEQNHTKNFIEAKKNLKLNDKNLPLTTDLNKWGKINLVEGSYPYKFNSKESKLKINNNLNETKDFYNYKVSIKGIELQREGLSLQKIDVTDKTYKNIFLSFIDLVYDSNDPTSFVRVIKDSIYIYEKGIRKFSLKKKKLSILLL